MTYRVLLLQGGQIFCLTMKTVYVYVFRTASATVYCTVKQLTNDRRAEICARLQWQGCTGTFTMIVSDEQLHFYRLCGTSMYSNVLAVNWGDKQTRRVWDRDFVKFERSRRYRDRYRCQEKKSRRGRDRDLVFQDPPTPRTRARSLIANRHLHNNNNIVALVHTTAVATFTTTTIL